MAECRNCGANPQKESVCLVRVNPLGEDGVFECTPSCYNFADDELNFLRAIEFIIDMEPEEFYNLTKEENYE